MVMRNVLLVLVFVLIAAGCGTSDKALMESGYNASYILGFHDGRHSGMQEAGNSFEHYIKDENRYSSDADYQQGWLAGEAEGKKLQAEATTIGKGVAGAYPNKSSSSNSDDIAKDALKDVDTSELKNLE
jgi:hypothetical protein